MTTHSTIMARKLNWKILAFLALLLVMQGCYDATTVTIDNSQTITRTVSFKADVIPLFNKNCNTAGCHAPGGRKPDLSEANAYNSLITGNYVNVGAPEQSTIYLYLTGKKTPQMPLGSAANPNNINQFVLAWIIQGAKNN